MALGVRPRGEHWLIVYVGFEEPRHKDLRLSRSHPACRVRLRHCRDCPEACPARAENPGMSVSGGDGLPLPGAPAGDLPCWWGLQWSAAHRRLGGLVAERPSAVSRVRASGSAFRCGLLVRSSDLP
jgi:hypothetical protein